MPDVQCGMVYITGPRKGTICNRRAGMYSLPARTFVCGIHARTYTRRGLIRLARWNPREEQWV